MKNKLFSKAVALFVAVIMIIGMLPMQIFASEAVLSQSKATANGFPSNMTLVSEKENELAPGITERQCVVYDQGGSRVAVYIATADVSVDTVKIYANYKDNQNNVWGMQKTTEQAAAFEANHEGENVIVAINASYFNTNTGKPDGAFVMEGNDVTTESAGNAKPFFALLKDGTYMIGAANEYSSYKGQIQEAIGGYIHLVKDGEICSGLDNRDKYPRQTIGITADGQVIVMTADCVGAADSAGLTVYEQAEVMLSLGCVEALHLDGGGSGTYCSRPVGEEKLVVTNNPSNGTERAVSNTLILVSTAKPDGEFDRANLTAEYNYVTPGSVVNVSAIGLDQAGGMAEIPEECSLKVVNSSIGTVSNGVFTSNGTIGDAVIQMEYNGTVVGETTIHVVNPDRFDLNGRTTIIIPNDGNVDLPLKAYYGVNEVYYNLSDIEINAENPSAVTISGLNIKAPSEESGITETNLTISLIADESVSFSVALKFGKASEVLFDFEDGTKGTDLDNWILRTHEYNDDRYNEKGDIYIVDKDSGLVHSGNQALAFHTDFSQLSGNGTANSGYNALSISWGGDPINVKGAQKIGFWVYVPEDAVAVEFTMNTVYYDANGNAQRRTVDCMDDNGKLIYTPYWSTNMEGSGWRYVEADFSQYSNDLLIKDEPNVPKGYKNNFLIKIYCVSGGYNKDLSDYYGDFTFYIDDITVDYSSAVEDRKLPVFGDSYVYGSGVEKTLKYNDVVEIAESNLVFAAEVSDNKTHDTYVGLDSTTARIFVDGYAVDATYADGMISSNALNLADGYHRICFEIADNNGNVMAITREIKVKAGSQKPTVELVPHNESLDRLLSGSVYWADLVSDNISGIDSVEVTLNLNSTHDFQLDHMEVADGFDVTWSQTPVQVAQNDVTIKITRNGEAVSTDSNVIVSIPVRIWESLIHETPRFSANTPASQWAAGEIVDRQIVIKVDAGKVIFADGNEEFFSGKIVKDHEGYEDHYLMDKEYFEAKKAEGAFHTHTVTSLDDCAATCNKDGYIGRTYCAVCDSVVDWGTTLEATGHSYDFVEDVLKCVCGDLFNGEFTDGKFYVDGVAFIEGWYGESYYKDGVKCTGVCEVDGYYYDFGENGICTDMIKYSGLFYDKSVSAYRYVKLGVAQGGWVMIGDYWHYFNTTTKVAVTGVKYWERVFTFDETGRTEGAWYKTADGIRYYYGPSYYVANNQYQKRFVEIDGKTYNFDVDGYLTTGIHALYEDWTSLMRAEMNVWEFDENGVLIGQITTPGLINDKRGAWYLIEEDGQVTGRSVGLIEYNGDIYFRNHSGRLKTNSYATITSSNSNGILESGNYYFGEDAKLFTGVKKDDDGILYYYKDGKLGNGIYNSELVKINDSIYLVKWSGKVAVNEIRDITSKYSNGFATGKYEFDENGKGSDISAFTGIKRGEDGILYYYRDGQIGNRIYNSELAVIDGSIYLVKWSGKIATNEMRTITTKYSNGLLSTGTYYFGEDGKLYSGILTGEDGILYYYENGKLGNRIYNSELAVINGEIYLVKWSGKVAANETRVITKTSSNGLLESGTYYFGEDGRLFTGVKADEDGCLYYYENGKLGNGIYNSKLAEINGEIYLVKWSGKVAVNETREITKANNKGLIEPGTYYFGEDGKLQK